MIKIFIVILLLTKYNGQDSLSEFLLIFSAEKYFTGRACRLTLWCKRVGEIMSEGISPMIKNKSNLVIKGVLFPLLW